MTTFSIIIPVKRGGHIAAIDTIRQLSLDSSLYELLVAEGAAPSQQRNLAARDAKGEILYFLDDDSILGPENLHICSEIMNDSGVAVVGGPSITPSTDGCLQQVFGYALTSSLGAGAVRNRYRATGTVRVTSEKELILCNLAVRRTVFFDLGGFDERLYPNEENELLDRIRGAGLKLIHVPAMAVFRSQRASLKAFIRQMFAYGRGRAQQSLLSRSFSFVSFVPLFFNIYIITLALFPNYEFLLLPAIVYSILVVLFMLSGVYQTGHLYMVMLLLIYPLIHCANGMGLLCGLIGGKPIPVRDDDIVVRKIKEIGRELSEA